MGAAVCVLWRMFCKWGMLMLIASQLQKVVEAPQMFPLTGTVSFLSTFFNWCELKNSQAEFVNLWSLTWFLVLLEKKSSMSCSSYPTRTLSASTDLKKLCRWWVWLTVSAPFQTPSRHCPRALRIPLIKQNCLGQSLNQDGEEDLGGQCDLHRCLSIQHRVWTEPVLSRHLSGWIKC